MIEIIIPQLPSRIFAVAPETEAKILCVVNGAVDVLEAGLKNASDCELARTYLTTLQAQKSVVNKQRDILLKPFKGIVDEIKSATERALATVEPVQVALKEAIGGYLLERQREEAANLAAALKAQAQPAPEGRVTPALPDLPVPVALPKVSTYVHRDIQIDDPTKVPDTYYILDMVRLKRDALDGKKIPGVSIIEETKVAAR